MNCQRKKNQNCLEFAENNAAEVLEEITDENGYLPTEYIYYKEQLIEIIKFCQTPEKKQYNDFKKEMDKLRKHFTKKQLEDMFNKEI